MVLVDRTLKDNGGFGLDFEVPQYFEVKADSQPGGDDDSSTYGSVCPIRFPSGLREHGVALFIEGDWFSCTRYIGSWKWNRVDTTECRVSELSSGELAEMIAGIVEIAIVEMVDDD